MSFRYSFLVLFFSLLPFRVEASNGTNYIIVCDIATPENADNLDFQYKLVKTITDKVLPGVSDLHNAKFTFINSLTRNGNEFLPGRESIEPFGFSSVDDFKKTITSELDEIEVTEEKNDSIFAPYTILKYLKKTTSPFEKTYVIFFSKWGVNNFAQSPYISFATSQRNSEKVSIKYNHLIMDLSFDYDIFVNYFELTPPASLLNFSNKQIKFERKTTKSHTIKVINTTGNENALTIHFSNDHISLEPLEYSIQLDTPSAVLILEKKLIWCKEPVARKCLTLKYTSPLHNGDQLPIIQLLEPYLYMDSTDANAAYNAINGILTIKGRYINGIYDNLIYQDTCYFNLQIAKPAVLDYLVGEDITLTNQELLSRAGGREITQIELVKIHKEKQKSRYLIITFILIGCIIISILIYYLQKGSKADPAYNSSPLTKWLKSKVRRPI